MNRFFLLLIAALLITGVAKAQVNNAAPQTFQFSIQQAVAYALQHKNDVLNAQLDEEITQKKAKEILSTSYPQISGNVQFQDYIAIPTQLLPGEFFGAPPGTYIPVKFGIQYNMSAGLSATQLIADGSYFVAAKATKTLLELSKKSTDRTEQETNVAVTKAYYSVLVNEKRMNLLQANLDKLKKLTSDTKALWDNGFAEKIDYDRVNVGYNNLLTEQNNVKQLIDLTYYLLKFQMGMDVNAHLVLTDSLDETKLADENLMTQNFDPKNRIEFQMLMTQHTLYGLDVKRNQLSYLPSLAAFGTLSYAAERNKINFLDNEHWYPTGIIGLQLSVPIFDGFAKAARIQQGKLTLEKNANDQLNLQNAIQLEVNSARITLGNDLKTLQSQKDNMKLANSVYDAAKKKYDAGVGSNLEVINASTDLKTAETNYLNAVYDAWIAKIDLQKATGNLK